MNRHPRGAHRSAASTVPATSRLAGRQARLIRLMFASALILAAAIGLLANQAFAEDRYGKQKVVYHINEDDLAGHKVALANIQNHINAVGKDNLELIVVLNGNGVSLLLEPDSLPQLPKFRRASADQDMAANIDTLKGQGVQFQVCNTTLTRRGATKDDLYGVDEGDIVPSGVAEVARLQLKGYAYIKP